MENKYCIIRCDRAGVFAGIVKERKMTTAAARSKNSRCIILWRNDV